MALKGVDTHVILGENNIVTLPFLSDIKGIILYHHESPDGRGILKLKGENLLLAEILHVADYLDMKYSNIMISESEFKEAKAELVLRSGRQLSERAVDMACQNISYYDIENLAENGAYNSLHQMAPGTMHNYQKHDIEMIAGFFERIIDYKSSFTKRHSIGVSNKAKFFANYYGWDDEKKLRFYFAGALHDIGKLLVSNSILEKPDKLTAEEFIEMKYHAEATYMILSKMKEMEDITEWAANHHEKLDGTGYPRGLDAEQQTFEDRLMACIDIYQALTEERPYKPGFSHDKAMGIMQDMADQGKTDPKITADFAEVFAEKSQKTSDIKREAEENPNQKKWKCPSCGYIHIGDEPPARCPVCDTPGDIFQLMD